jgi:hypothetical protein
VSPTPFDVHVPDEEPSDLRRRLGASRSIEPLVSNVTLGA